MRKSLRSAVRLLINNFRWYIQKLFFVLNIDFNRREYDHEIIQFNKFFRLHDGEKVFVCKIDFIENDFEKIRQLTDNVVLVTGNGDRPVDESLLHKMPDNVMCWYAQNALVRHPKVIPIPLGIENYEFANRRGHGITYRRAGEKLRLLSRDIDITQSKFMYANFKISTNPEHRQPLYDYIRDISHIDVDEPTLSNVQFFDKILDYKMVLCPIGNGVDTHRLWEVLYAGRVPVVIRAGNYAIYDLYQNLPVIILKNMQELLDLKLLESVYLKIKSANCNYQFLEFSFWENELKLFSKYNC